MGQLVKIVAQQAQDDYEQNYASGVSFFTIDDFIQRVGNVAADFYRQGWMQQYQELRQEKRDEVVGFEPSVLNEQFIEIKRENGEFIGQLEKPAMSLPYDNQTSGVQNVFDAKTGTELERSSINQTWQYQYQPYTNRHFYRIEKDKIKVFTKGICSVNKVRVLYVPSITVGDGEAELPDGIVNYVIVTAVSQMRAMNQQRVVKTSLDGNPNLIMEAEINKESIK